MAMGLTVLPHSHFYVGGSKVEDFGVSIKKLNVRDLSFLPVSSTFRPSFPLSRPLSLLPIPPAAFISCLFCDLFTTHPSRHP